MKAGALGFRIIMHEQGDMIGILTKTFTTSGRMTATNVWYNGIVEQ